ncbi:MAG: hypothetical protein ACI936_000448 [Paraglaciecola sp.]|jgi:hypothetical protein
MSAFRKVKNYNSVSVSELSTYASDPTRFCEVKGKAFNERSAKWGTQMHEKAGVGSYKPLIVTALLVIVIGSIYLWVM